jgi:hypothetical protein
LVCLVVVVVVAREEAVELAAQSRAVHRREAAPAAAEVAGLADLVADPDIEIAVVARGE